MRSEQAQQRRWRHDKERMQRRRKRMIALLCTKAIRATRCSLSPNERSMLVPRRPLVQNSLMMKELAWALSSGQLGTLGLAVEDLYRPLRLRLLAWALSFKIFTTSGTGE